MKFSYDKDKIKNEITDEQMFDLLNELGAEPQWQGNIITNRTICHCGSSHKLYYYSNSKLFHCFTDCSASFDIYELIRKVMSREYPKAREDSEWNLPEAIEWIAQKFGYAPNVLEEEEEVNIKKDLEYLENYDRIKDIDIKTQQIELKEYDDSILKNLPHPVITPWIESNISQDILDKYEICYDPKNCGIVIPHRDIKGRLVGIRERNLAQENIDMYGKYRPAFLCGKMYNHPLSYNVYGLYQNKENIKKFKKAFIFESEKAVLQYGTMFGQENNIACGICGSSFINYQFWLLMSLGVEEIIIGLDHDFTDLTSAEAQRIIKNLKSIHKKYGNYVKISFLWDKKNLTGLKASPTDEGKDKFLYLYKNRINLY